ncbi:MAG TPA: adenosylmethionine decarboxylase [Ktedonobacterales bacterium]|nr:adenosylmethionine decarboxylase [Ktedonobacterales bacterium]
MFGPHLIIDGTRCDTKKLADRTIVEQVLNDYPAAIGMTKIGGPYMFEYQAPDPAYSGVSGIVVIAESHIAIHTFPELDYFTMDVFSCKNFDHELAIDYIKNAFDVQEMDRMLVQRGLSFKGPHHGKLGATDELIAAAEARLAAGIVSKEPAIADAPAAQLDGVREAALARHTSRADDGAPANAPAGRMLWPQYGVTPDLGTYGEEAACEPRARDGAKIIALSGASEAPLGLDGRTLPAAESIQVNPTASISGLLDKLAATAGPGRQLGAALAAWEALARDQQATIALTLAQPVIAEGLRETLVYAIERRYADVVIASADDLFADLYEALGHVHFAGEHGPIASDGGREAAAAFFAAFLDELDAAAIGTTADLWHALGELLPTRAPRKGVLQAAAAAGVRIFTPDLGTSAFGAALVAARAHGHALTLDPADDVMALARLLSGAARLGVIRAGEAASGALLAQARDVAAALGLATPALAGSVTLGAPRPLAPGERHVVLGAEPGMLLPLIVTGLAQRLPAGRKTPVVGHAATTGDLIAAREHQAALA